MTSRSRRRGSFESRRQRRDRADSLESRYFGPSGHTTTHTALARLEHDRRSHQLCRQIREQLELALAELDDPLLEDLVVGDVVGAGPNAVRVELRVSNDAPLDRVHERLALLRGRLRAEAAAAITRKRAPMLLLAVLPTHARRVDQEDDHESR